MATVKKAMVKKAAKKSAPKMMKKAAPMMQAPPSASAPMGGGPMMKKGGKLKKAKDGDKQPPTYKNLKMGVENSRKGSTPTKQDSALYKFGYDRGLKGEKEYPSEPPIQKMGRWEGQNVGKTAPKKKIGGAVKAKSGGSFPDLNKDGKITQKDILIGKGVLPKTAKKGASMKKAGMHKMPNGSMMKNSSMKMGGKMTKKCKYGCK